MERLRILITGGNGFIGANLANYFSTKGHEVAITIRTDKNNWRISNIVSSITIFKGDLTKLTVVSQIFDSFKPDIVIHTAAFGGSFFETNVKQIFDTNITSTINLVDAFLKSNSQLFLNTGSSSEYGIKQTPMTERDKLNPIGAYAVSKVATTLYCSSKAIETGRNILTFRLFSAYGYFEGPHRLIPYILNSALRGTDLQLNSPNNVRDFIFIGDICMAYESATLNMNKVRHQNGEIFNLGSGIETKVSRVVDLVEKLSGKTLRINWKYGNERIGDRAIHWQADTSRIRDLLKWRAKYTLEKGLYNTLNWIEENFLLYENLFNKNVKTHK